MPQINPREIKGAWRRGFALDVHTLRSEPIGPGPSGRTLFNTTYTELGALLNRLKYSQDATAAPPIIGAAINYLLPHRSHFDVLIPVPPSSQRAIQPVLLLATAIGAGIGVPVANCVRTTRTPTSLKDVDDPRKRKELLQGLYTVDPSVTTGRKALLFDDLYRSGATMNAITEVLNGLGRAAIVNAFVITCTRTKR